jgi:hypothetical protein
MRPYPRNSPQAAARIVALALLADGHLSRHELELLDATRAHAQLGLTREGLQGVVHAFCEDLLAAAQLDWSEACRVDEHTLAALLADVEDPALRLRVLELCIAVVEADSHVGEGESLVISATVAQWGLARAALARAALPVAA